MSYQKAYGRINWENYPSDKTPLNEANLNKIDYAVNEVDNRILELDVKKLDLAVANGMVKSLTYNQANGVFTITYLNGSSDTIDTKMEKLAVNFSYDPTAQQLIITLDDGTTQKVDLSALITQYEFSDTDTVAFSVDGDGKVSANVKNGSITEDKLQPNYLADIKVEVAKAQSSATAAANSESNAKASENAAKTSETNAKTSETNAAGSASTASTKAAAAADSASAAAASESNALNSAKTASDKATAASNSATTATSKANEASASASNAASSASTAASKASEASDCATAAESYAHGGTGTRAGEDTDNAAYYYHQSKSISESFAGALRPMGTVTFASLPSLENVTSGDMYNISDEFTTTAEFNEGSGNVIPAGANVYKTADGYWDVLAGSPVTGVKGDAESNYHRGNINITPESIGALSLRGGAVTGDAQFLSNVYFKANIHAIYNMIWRQQHAYGDSRDSIIWAEPITIQDKNGNRVGYISMRYNTEGGADLTLGADHGNILCNNNVYIGGDRVATYNYLENFLKLTGGTVRGDVTYTSPAASPIIVKANNPRESSIKFQLGDKEWVIGLGCGGTSNNVFAIWSTAVGRNMIAIVPDMFYVYSDMNLNGRNITGVNSVHTSNEIYAENLVECRKGVFRTVATNMQLRTSGRVSVLDYIGGAYVPIYASAFTNQSSKRYKKNIEDLSEERAKKLLDLRVVTFDYINEANGTDCIGLIAEEVEEVEKYPVYYNQDDEPDSIDYSKLVPQLIKMVQMQQKQIDELKLSLSQCMKIIAEGHTEQTE